jgi:hypothetical protein
MIKELQEGNKPKIVIISKDPNEAEIAHQMSLLIENLMTKEVNEI